MNKNPVCPVCVNENTKKLYKNYPGYCEKENYDIYNCSSCNTNFIRTDSIEEGIYDTIYSCSESLAFDRYFEYAKNVKKVDNPLKYLSRKEPCYFPVYKYLKGKKDIKILEIGCGFGYLTYALNKAGFDTLGLDIARNVIDYAKQNYGDFYKCCELKTFIENTDEKFDLVIATEVIEHLEDHVSFILDGVSLLKPDGQLLLTTPNKNFHGRNAVWQTYLPPVHTIWLSKESFIHILEKHNFQYTFFNYSSFFPNYENRFVRYLKNQKEIIPPSFIMKDGTINKAYKDVKKSKLHNSVGFLLHRFWPVRTISNILYNIFMGDESTLSVFISKK